MEHNGDSPADSESCGSKSTIRQLGNRLSIRRKKKATGPDKLGVKHISQKEALEIQQFLESEYKYSTSTLLELCGLASATVIAKTYPISAPPQSGKWKILVVCGSSFGGGVGLVAARHLKLFGYQPTVYYPKPSLDPLYKEIYGQLEALELSSLSYLPTEPQLITHSYDLIVDALFGVGWDGIVSDQLAEAIQRLRKADLPTVSIDVPAGWRIDKGRPSEVSDSMITHPHLVPETLISIIAPKLCAQSYQGRQHYLVAFFVPKMLEGKFGLTYPRLPDGQLTVNLSEAEYDVKVPNVGGNNKEDDGLDLQLQLS